MCVFAVGPSKAIEILKSFPGVTFDGVAERAVELKGPLGFKVGSLPDLRSWKMAQGRDKDLADVGAIDNFSRLQGAEAAHHRPLGPRRMVGFSGKLKPIQVEVNYEH